MTDNENNWEEEAKEGAYKIASAMGVKIEDVAAAVEAIPDGIPAEAPVSRLSELAMKSDYKFYPNEMAPLKPPEGSETDEKPAGEILDDVGEMVEPENVMYVKDGAEDEPEKPEVTTPREMFDEQFDRKMERAEKSRESDEDETKDEERLTRTSLLDKAAETVGTRDGSHGEPEDNFERIAEMWTTYLGVDIKPHQVADMMIALKLCRIASGHPDTDHHTDICGYGTLGGYLADRDGENEPDKNTDAETGEPGEDTVSNLYFTDEGSEPGLKARLTDGRTVDVENIGDVDVTVEGE